SVFAVGRRRTPSDAVGRSSTFLLLPHRPLVGTDSTHRVWNGTAGAGSPRCAFMRSHRFADGVPTASRTWSGLVRGLPSRAWARGRDPAQRLAGVTQAVLADADAARTTVSGCGAGRAT